MYFPLSPHCVSLLMVTSRSKHAGDVIKQTKILTGCVLLYLLIEFPMLILFTDNT